MWLHVVWGLAGPRETDYCHYITDFSIPTSHALYRVNQALNGAGYYFRNGEWVWSSYLLRDQGGYYFYNSMSLYMAVLKAIIGLGRVRKLVSGSR